jgi:hypothetical protein
MKCFELRILYSSLSDAYCQSVFQPILELNLAMYET